MIRHLLGWTGSTLLVLLAAVVGAAAWLVGSESGTQWLLATAARQLDGQATNVTGTLWHGVRVGHLDVRVAGTEVAADDLDLTVAWPELMQQRLHVQSLTVAALRVALPPDDAQAPADDDADAPGRWSLPFAVKVDHLAVQQFALLRDGAPLLPVTLSGLQGALDVIGGKADARVDALHVIHEAGRADVSGKVHLDALADPWPLTAQVQATAVGATPASPLCVARYVGADARAGCTIEARATLDGSLQQMNIKLDADSAGARLALQAGATPRGRLPLKNATIDLRLPDRSALRADFLMTPRAGGQHLAGKLDATRFDLGRFWGPDLPPAILSAKGGFALTLSDAYVFEDGQLDLRIAPESRWNKQPLSGTAVVQAASDTHKASAGWPDALAQLRVDTLDIDVRLGSNRVRANGALAQAQGKLDLDINAPALAAFWPDLPGAAVLKAGLTGTPARHSLQLDGHYVPAQPRAGQLGRSRADVTLALEGAYDAAQGWRGTVARLRASHAGFSVNTARPVSVAFAPDAVAPAWQWQVGPTNIGVGLPGGENVSIQHQGSRGAPGRWETAGRLDNLLITPALVRDIRRAQDPSEAAAALARAKQRPQRVNSGVAAAQRRIALDAVWNLRFAGSLAGKATLTRRSGDLRIPGDPPIPLGLRKLVLDITATPAGANRSRLDANLDLATEKMGTLRGNGSTVLTTPPGSSVPALGQRDPIRVNLDANIADLAWLDLFTGDATEVGGALQARVAAQGSLAGPWTTSGTVRAQNLRVVRIDEGVRLLDGTLAARFENDSFVLESLRFPAMERVLPADARTRQWIQRSEDAKGGYAEARGRWNLQASSGQVEVTLYRFPAVQRADRYVMASGRVTINADLPRVVLRGSIVADAGWASIEALGAVPTLDDDVHVHRPGEAEKTQTGPPLQVDMDIDVNLGKRFYLTGLGLDAGLEGSLDILYVDGRLSGMGVLRAVRGRFEAYGQRLQLRRSTVTFQGPLDNPLLDIEALRTGEQVEAGVKVTGTARRPRIDLVSYPDVSDEEKLSWLVLGRGLDSGGNGSALLMAAGAALLGNGEPFYRRFGLDDVSVRNGAIGSSGSVLPAESVVSAINQNSDNDLATQFIVASKRFSNGITLSIEQALAGSQTVGRASYRLARGLSLDIKAGGVTGIELIYRTFWGD